MSAMGLLGIVMLFELSAFALLAFRSEGFDPLALLFALILIAVLFLQYVCMLWISKYADRFILVIANLLAAIGMIVQYRLSPDTAFKQLILYGAGLLAMFVCVAIMHKPALFQKLNWVMILGSLGLLCVLMAVGKEHGGAKNWITIARVSFQPSEFVKLALVFVSANYLTTRRSWRGYWPSAVFAIACCGLLVAERDLGAALLIALTYLILFYIATGNVRTTLIGMGAGCMGAAASYVTFDYVRARVAIWKNPWATYETSGYQIAQGLMAIASGGAWGLGLTLGSPKAIPAYNTDYIFAVICEEFGIIFGIAVIALYLVFIIRGALLALNARDRYLMLIAFGCTSLITLQSFIIIGGVIKLIPLTGITMPFVSYGGSSLIASMMLLGILEGVAMRNGEMLEDAMDAAMEECRKEERAHAG
jgi:cell division protein FtsW (lipid II flippase)